MHKKTEHQLPTAVWRNGGCSASYDSLVVGSSAVLRLNFCAKNPPLRQAAKRCVKFPPIKKPAIRGGLRKVGMKQDVQENPHSDRLIKTAVKTKEAYYG